MNNSTSEHQSTSSSDAAPLTPGKGLIVLALLVVAIGAFLVLCNQVGVTEAWVGCLFLFYWGGLEKADMKKIAAAVVGASFGLLMAFLLQQLPLWLGASTGGLIFLGVLIALLYFLLMGWLPTAVNMATMLFLTVGTIPSIQSAFRFPYAAIALALGIAYFGGLVWVATLLPKKDSAKV